MAGETTSSPPPNARSWRFTWETLAHIPTLRLYLFNPDIDPSARCHNLRTSLRLDESLLLVHWVDVGDIQLRVPVPRVLIDPSYPLDCLAKQDHIEVKLALVLPVDHPLVANLGGVLDPGAAESSNQLLPLSLASDLKNLCSGDVHFYCKTCSAKLTRQPLSRFVEMPSVNWQEIADNWFGGCCCSFGGASEKLVSQYNKTYDCSKGTCLLSDASVILSKKDLEGCIFENCSDGYLKYNNRMHMAASDSVSETITNVCVDSSVANSAGTTNTDLDGESFEYKTFKEVTDPLSFPLLSSTVCCGNIPLGSDSISTGSTHVDELQDAIEADISKLVLSHAILEKPVSESLDELSSDDHRHCCADRTSNGLVFAHGKPGQGSSVSPGMVQQSTGVSVSERGQKWLHNSSLGSGFIFRNSNLSNDVEWVEFACRQCSSPLGCYPSLTNTNVPVDGGVRLFKCYVSTSIPTCGTQDIFRKHTLDRVFVNSLLESAEDELAFRTIVKDVRTKSVMLQIVLLNSKAWFSNGYCYENVSMESSFEADLQPVVKVLFSDCSTATETGSRMIKEWSTKTHVEEVYMMSREIEELTKHLKMALERLPFSCSSLQGMFLSSLESYGVCKFVAYDSGFVKKNITLTQLKSQFSGSSL